MRCTRATAMPRRKSSLSIVDRTFCYTVRLGSSAVGWSSCCVPGCGAWRGISHTSQRKVTLLQRLLTAPRYQRCREVWLGCQHPVPRSHLGHLTCRTHGTFWVVLSRILCSMSYSVIPAGACGSIRQRHLMAWGRQSWDTLTVNVCPCGRVQSQRLCQGLFQEGSGNEPQASALACSDVACNCVG